MPATYKHRFPPRKTTTEKCIVLDIDETQMHSYEHSKAVRRGIFDQTQTIAYRDRMYQLHLPYGGGVGSIQKMWGIKRPHLDEFLQFAFDHFRVVAIWSAGDHDYVWQITQQTWAQGPHVIYTARDLEEQCVECGDLAGPYSDRSCDRCPGSYRFVKPLRKFWDHPKWGTYMKPENTVIVDDRRSVFAPCNPHNGLQIPTWKPKDRVTGLKKKDDALFKVMEFFKSNEFVRATDVRTLDMDIFPHSKYRSDD